MKQYQILSSVRHLHHVFFVDENYKYDDLFNLMCFNLKKWGGRHNPIIPIVNNNLSENYISLLKNFDPDYIFYTSDVDEEYIKSLGIFNPRGFIKIGSGGLGMTIPGVEALYLFEKNYPESHIVLQRKLTGVSENLINYFKINYGIEPTIVHFTKKIIPDNNQIKFESSDSLYKTICNIQFISRSELSHHSGSAKNLISEDTATVAREIEIVIAKNRNNSSDLIYFWNRSLYGHKKLFFATLDEITILIEDIYFFYHLHQLNLWDKEIQLSSTTLTDIEMKEVMDSIDLKLITERKLNLNFSHFKIVDFPYTIKGVEDYRFTRNIKSQTIISDNGLFHPPQPYFKDKLMEDNHWAVDLKINRLDTQAKIKFPLTTQVSRIAHKSDGRINLSRDISIFMSNESQEDALTFLIPEFSTLLSQIICSPSTLGKSKYCYSHISLHDASNKLMAFLKTFNYDLGVVNDFFTDAFWVEIFKELINNKKFAGDTILFKEIKDKALKALSLKGIQLSEKQLSFHNEENLELGLKATIGELCSYNVFLKGFNLKCPNCSSMFWYHIAEVSDKINCRGCIEQFELPIEPKFAYKLNDLIKNNISLPDLKPDGNLTVIRTLTYLYERDFRSFEFSPQINIFEHPNSSLPLTDIDIVCLSNGRLIIGEAKHNSSEFFSDKSKSLTSLVKIAKMIRPDILILSCTVDDNNKLQKAKQGLEHLFNDSNFKPEIEVLQLTPPDDSTVGDHRYFYY